MALSLPSTLAFCGDAIHVGKAPNPPATRVLVAPTGRNLPFFVERNGAVVACFDICEDRSHGARFGDIISCRLQYGSWEKIREPVVTNLTIIGHDEGMTPRQITADEFYKIDQDLAFVSIRGTVFDVCKDDIDSNFGFAFIDTGKKMITAAFGITDGAFPGMLALVGCEVMMTGVTGTSDTILTPAEGRRLPRRTIRIGGADNCRVLRPAVPNDDQTPDLTSEIGMTPETITSLPLLRQRHGAGCMAEEPCPGRLRKRHGMPSRTRDGRASRNRRRRRTRWTTRDRPLRRQSCACVVETFKHTRSSRSRATRNQNQKSP